MKVTRWPALAFFIVIMIAAFVLEDDEGISSIEQVFERNQAFLVGDRQDLSSTWYCVSGTVGTKTRARKGQVQYSTNSAGQ